MNHSAVRGFRPTLFVLGTIYILLASSMLVRGSSAMLEFGVPESVAHHPAFADFFMFWFQLMAGVGVLMALLGQVAKDRTSQTLTAAVLCAMNIGITLRDLSTSDSAWGNRLYKGPGTLIPVYIDLAFVTVFATLLVLGLRRRGAAADGG